MEPIKGNALNRSCGDIISSNCVTVPIAVPGVCGPNPTLTQVLTAISNESGKCCQGTFPVGHTSAYTGQWVDFSSSIPLAGVATGSFGFATWNISSFGTAGSGPPQYFWTPEGDLKFRGNFILTFTPSIPYMFYFITLFNFLPTNFPSGFTATQRTFLGAQMTGTQSIVQQAFAGLTINPTGALNLDITSFNSTLTSFSMTVELGAIRFNLA